MSADPATHPLESPIASEKKPRPAFHRWMDKLFIVIIVAVLISQFVIWNFWEPAIGDSIKNLITFAERIMLQICLIGWIFLFSPFSRKTMLLIGIPIASLIIGRFAMIKEIQWSGDMEGHIIWRWEKSRDEVLTEHLNKQQPSKISEPQTAPEMTALDMPGYRGINRDGVITGPPLKQDWSNDPPQQLWKHPVGGGYAGIAVVGPLVLTLEQRQTDETVACYDAATGAEIWTQSYPANFQEAMGGEGPRSTPTIDGDAVYTLGAIGDLFCLDLLSGKPRWHVNVLQQFGLPNNHWAMSSSPLVYGDDLIVNVGGRKGNGLVAYNKSDGKVKWKTAGLGDPLPIEKYVTGVTGAPADQSFIVPGYASPMLATIAEVPQILNLDGAALRGHNPETGEELWSFPFHNDPDVNVAQPIVFADGRIFLSASYDVGATMAQVSVDTEGKWSATELWKNINMRCKFTSPVLYDGYLYGIDEAIMVCLDPATGKRLWKGGKTELRGRYGHGQILLVNNQIVVLTEKGQIALIEPSPKELIEIGHMQVLEGEKTWNHHAIAGGKVYVRNAYEMGCFNLTKE